MFHGIFPIAALNESMHAYAAILLLLWYPRILYYAARKIIMVFQNVYYYSIPEIHVQSEL